MLSAFFSSCSHKVVRSGYQSSDVEKFYCNIPIQKFISVSDTLAEKVGEIRLGDGGLSTKCSEAHAVMTLRREACSINADLIIITEEKLPDGWSSCYRCRASFYRYFKEQPNQEYETEEDSYTLQEAKKRTSENEASLIGFIVGSVVATVIIGLLSF